jgi:hypothetical protein
MAGTAVQLPQNTLRQAEVVNGQQRRRCRTHPTCMAQLPWTSGNGSARMVCAINCLEGWSRTRHNQHDSCHAGAAASGWEYDNRGWPGRIAMNTEMSEGNSPGDVLRALSRELENFREIAEQLQPQPCDVPQLHAIDIWGDARPQRSGGRRPPYLRRLQEAVRLAVEDRGREPGGPARYRRTPPPMSADGWDCARFMGDDRVLMRLAF